MCLCLVKVIGDDGVKLVLNFCLVDIGSVDMRKPCLVSDGSMGGTGFMSWGNCTIS